MARNPNIHHSTAESPFDEKPTSAFEEIVADVKGTGETTPEDVLEAVYKGVNPDIIDGGDGAAIAHVYESIRQLPDVSSDIVTTLGKVNQDQQTSGLSGSPDIHEQRLFTLGVAELYLSKKRHDLRKLDTAVADDPSSKVGDVQALIDTIVPTVPEDQREKFEKDKQAVGYLLSAEDREKAEQLRQSVAGEYYKIATDFAGRITTDDENKQLHAVRAKVADLTKRDAAEAHALEVLQAYLPKLDEVPEAAKQLGNAEDIEQAKANLKELEQQLGMLYAMREQKSRVDISMRREKNQQLLADYRAASNKLFMLENAAMLDDANVSEEEKIEAVALHTLKQGRALEEAKLAQDGRTRFRRVIHKLGEQISKHPYITGLVSLTGGVLLSTVTAGAAAGVTAGALAYIKAEHLHQKKRKSRDADALIIDNEDSRDDLYNSLVDVVDSRYDDEEDYRLDRAAIAEMLEHGHGANEALLEGRVKKEQWRRMGTMAIAGAVGGVGWLGAHHLGFDQNNWGGDTTHAAPIAPETPAPGPDVPHTPDWPSAPEVPVHEFAPGTFTAHPGDGYYNILERMGVPAAERYNVLASVTQELGKYSYFQPGDPLPRIPRPGSLPQGAIDILTKAVSR